MRKQSAPGDPSSVATETTNIDIKLSAREFATMVTNSGYKAEGQVVLAFLNGVGEYDQQTKQYYFTLKDLYKYRQMMIEVAPRGVYETDIDFHEFLFKSISSNDQTISVSDLDKSIKTFDFQENFARHSDKIIDKTAG